MNTGVLNVSINFDQIIIVNLNDIDLICSELTIRRVVVGVLLMVLLLPGFDVEYGLWGQYEGVDRGGLWMLHEMAIGGGGNGTEAFAVALQVSDDSWYFIEKT